MQAASIRVDCRLWSPGSGDGVPTPVSWVRCHSVYRSGFVAAAFRIGPDQPRDEDVTRIGEDCVATGD